MLKYVALLVTFMALFFFIFYKCELCAKPAKGKQKQQVIAIKISGFMKTKTGAT